MNILRNVLRRRGDEARDRQDWTHAIYYYKLYVWLVPTDSAILIQLGHAFKESGQFAEARAAYQSALELSPMDADLHLQIGHLHKVSGNLHGAIGSYRRALEIDPQFSEAKQQLVPYIDILEANEEQSTSTISGIPTDADLERDRNLNFEEAALDCHAVRAAEHVLDSLEKRLPDPRAWDDGDRVPPFFHFFHGFHDCHRAADFPFYAYIAIRSALHFNPGWIAFLYCPTEPTGPNWERIKSQVDLKIVGPFDYFRRSRLFRGDHKADALRLNVINRIGGICLDTDTITQRSFEDLRSVDFCMGVQAAGWTSPPTLNNAVMIGRASAGFSTRWLRYYDGFRSIGQDGLGEYYSFTLPTRLMQEFPETISVLGYRAFFYPLWYTAGDVLFLDSGQKYRSALSEAYCFNLWSKKTGKALASVNDDFIRNSRSIYAEIARCVEGKGR